MKFCWQNVWFMVQVQGILQAKSRQNKKSDKMTSSATRKMVLAGEDCTRELTRRHVGSCRGERTGVCISAKADDIRTAQTSNPESLRHLASGP